WVPLTRSSANSAILAFDVIQLSLTAVVTSFVVLFTASVVSFVVLFTASVVLFTASFDSSALSAAPAASGAATRAISNNIDIALLPCCMVEFLLWVTRDPWWLFAICVHAFGIVHCSSKGGAIAQTGVEQRRSLAPTDRGGKDCCVVSSAARRRGEGRRVLVSLRERVL